MLVVALMIISSLTALGWIGIQLADMQSQITSNLNCEQIAQYNAESCVAAYIEQANRPSWRAFAINDLDTLSPSLPEATRSIKSSKLFPMSSVAMELSMISIPLFFISIALF